MTRSFPRIVDGLAAAGLAALLSLFAATVAGAMQAPVDELQLHLQPVDTAQGPPSRLSADRQALLLPGGRSHNAAAARLQFVLPPTDPGEARWVVWIGRDAADRVALEGEGWTGVERDFFAPAQEEGLLPTGYQFPLPADWVGETSLVLRAEGGLRGALRPALLRETAVMRLEQRGSIFGAMIYAALFTLALLMLALYLAARDRIYLAFFGANALALLLMAAANGHLYQVPFIGLLGFWRGLGLWALGLLFLAAMLQLLRRYTPAATTMPRLARVTDGYCLVLGLMAAACLLGLPALYDGILVAGSALWALAFVLGGGLIIYAEPRRGRGIRTAALGLMAIAAGLLATGSFFPGHWIDAAWMRHAYQLAFVGASAVLAMGLISRIGDFRNQRDQDRLARLDSERRMRREAARSELTAALQDKLRTVGAGDLEWTGFRLLLDHLLPQVPAELAIATICDSHDRNILVSFPQSRQAEAEGLVAQRRLQLKRHAAAGISLQQPVAIPEAAGMGATEALVPIPIRAPAWGLLMLQRSGEQGFTSDELALADELLRLTLLHIEQVLAAINLRRSAEIDALTGTFNRRTLDQWMARCFIEAKRDDQPISVLFADMDHFKRINDTYGHACGDECLRRVATALQAQLAQGDLFGRYGGEEFIAVLPGRNGAEAREIAERLRRSVEQLQVEWQGNVLPLTVSVGLAARVAGDDKPASMVDRADKALYAAKRNGRNCVHAAPASFA